MKESVNHPDHYIQNGMEVIDVINAFTKECVGAEAFYIGNVIKYVCRYKNKNGLEDLKKARWYLDKLIDIYDRSYILADNDIHELSEAFAKFGMTLTTGEDFECKRKKVLDALQKSESESLK